ncbi:MAG: YlxR family protein [Clostridia bacterium]|nr:YlxR family protein [Clostridia bacterium]
MRMCVACRQMRPKTELLRIVRTEDGSAVADRTGKRNGRGAYLCPSRACFEKAVKSRALERALEIGIDPALRETLLQEIEHAEQTV